MFKSAAVLPGAYCVHDTARRAITRVFAEKYWRSAFQPKRHRSVVDEAHLHIGAEFAGFDIIETCPASIDEAIEIVLALIGRRGTGKTRPHALFRISGQRELWHQQQAAVFIPEAMIHAACRVREHSVAEDALGKPGDVFFAIVAMYGDQGQQPRADFTDRQAIDADRC